MRKIGCLALVLMLLVLVIVPGAAPADALGQVSGVSEPETRYSVLQFDRVNFFVGSEFFSVPWPYNNSVVGSDAVSYDYGPVYGNILLRSSSDSIGGVMHVGGLDGGVINIYGGPQIVDVSRLYNEYDGLSGFVFFVGPYVGSYAVRSCQVHVEFYELSGDPTLSDGRVASEFHTMKSEVYMCNREGWFEVGDKLHELFVSAGCENYVFISKVTLAISFVDASDEPDTPAFAFDIGSTANHPANHFTSWVYTQNVPLTINEVGVGDINFYDWLVESVEAFLGFELAPGLSITKILYLIVVIGVLLWLIKLLV